MANLRTFSKAQLVSLLASSVDFGVTFALVKGLGFPQMAGNATGTISGGATHFLISRNWVFSAQRNQWASQLTRYMLVWVGNFALNNAGFYLLTHYTGMNFMLAKTIIAILIAVFYNYVLQKRYVFK